MTTMAVIQLFNIWHRYDLNAEWDNMGKDEVATGTSAETVISMRILWKQRIANVESTRLPYQWRPRRINGVVQMQPAVIQIATSQKTKQAAPGRSRRCGRLYVRSIGGGVVYTVLKVVDSSLR